MGRPSQGGARESGGAIVSLQEPAVRRSILRLAFCRGFADGARSSIKQGRHMVDTDAEIERWWRRGYDEARARMAAALLAVDDDLRREVGS